MTKTEKDLLRSFERLKIKEPIDCLAYTSVDNTPRYKLRTKDGRPLNLITPNKKNMLEMKGYIDGKEFNVALLYQRRDEEIETKRKKDEAKRLKKIERLNKNAA